MESVIEEWGGRDGNIADDVLPREMMSGEIASRFLATRRFTEQICRPLAIEDFVVQAMPDASPTRWHLAHSTWFFETFVLARWQADYQPFSADFQYLFNSYYNSVGEQFPRAQRGLLTRPTVAEVFAYRQAVDQRMNELLASRDDAELSQVVELGIQHEQQHQELILTDLKYLLSCNPLEPVYRESGIKQSAEAGQKARWKSFPGRHCLDRIWRPEIFLRQRTTAAPGFASAVRTERSARHLRRILGIHERRRVSTAGVLAVARLVDEARASVGGASLLDGARRPVARVHIKRHSASRAARARGACQLF